MNYLSKYHFRLFKSIMLKLKTDQSVDIKTEFRISVFEKYSVFIRHIWIWFREYIRYDEKYMISNCKI